MKENICINQLDHSRSKRQVAMRKILSLRVWLCDRVDVLYVCEFCVATIGIMANFSLLDDDDYGDLFLTQRSSQNAVSLEENMEFKTVHNSDYSDISDTEQDCLEERMR